MAHSEPQQILVLPSGCKPPKPSSAFLLLVILLSYFTEDLYDLGKLLFITSHEIDLESIILNSGLALVYPVVTLGNVGSSSFFFSGSLAVRGPHSGQGKEAFCVSFPLLIE